MKVEKISADHLPEYAAHEAVYEFSDAKTALAGFIAIHNTRLGPATGGTRFSAYPDKQAALRDALNLSRAMSYKCALSGVPFGGGKAVIISQGAKTPRLLQAYAEAVNTLGGRFTTGPDMGIDETDTAVMAGVSPYILGHAETGLKRLGTSEMAARGVYVGIRSLWQHLFQDREFSSARIAVKGLGKVGGELVRLLAADGASMCGADIDEQTVVKLKRSFADLQIVPTQSVAVQPVDIYSPCAYGDEFNQENIGQLSVRGIAGGANNQLSSPEVGDELHKLGILYAPDFIVNAGGLIDITDELHAGGYDPDRVMARVQAIADTLTRVIVASREQDMPTHRIARQFAEDIIKAA